VESVSLSEIVAALPGAAVDGAVGGRIGGIQYDSRRVAPGDLFVAVRGGQRDGNAYATEALARGAGAVVSALPRPASAAAGTWIRVADERVAMARAAAVVYGHPDRSLPVVGITGTNGKTTTSYLLEAMLEAAGRRPGLLGTVVYRWASVETRAARTTPESADLYRMLREMSLAGCRAAVLEVSSHALALARVEGLAFRVGVFTNLTQDHLDFHGTMDAYFAAKAKLFAALDPSATAVLNADDPRCADLRAQTRARVLTYGIDAEADVRLLASTSGFSGSTATLRLPEAEATVHLALPGRPNLWNLLAAAAAASALEVPVSSIVAGVEGVRGVPGRFERILAGQDFEVIVDYAHSDDALTNVLRTVRSLGPRRILTLFGCGGDRDRSKRPLMGEAAASGSDVVNLTSDNPRTEDPERIADDAEEGVRRAQHGAPRTIEYHRCLDRRAAIALAIGLARTGDAVVIAGKGHEHTQTIGGLAHPFDDRDVCRTALGERLRRE
jgi:UDP-N-acetylmuramoyl-L-alanyl-D-glutamate--2,6-diaminopimelate ligase